MKNFFRDQVILVTGVAGTVGKGLVSQLLDFGPGEIRALDHNESELFLMREHYHDKQNFVAYLGDVRDAQKMETVTRGVDILFHCAAYKHVYFSEYNPFEAVQTNILGVQNIIQAAIQNGVQRVIFSSSDKAVNPTNVMGTSKLMGERLITAANVISSTDKQRFSSVRFGNVLGSRGSVVPIFHEQIKKGGPVTVTNKSMTRFIMTIARAVQLVLEGAVLSRGGEVLVTKMAAIAINDLAEAMIEVLAPFYGFSPQAIHIEIIGAKPGEKMYEELLTAEEVERALDLEEMFVVPPAFRAIYRNIDYSYPGYNGKRPLHPYISSEEALMSKEDIKTFLTTNGLVPGVAASAQ